MVSIGRFSQINALLQSKTVVVSALPFIIGFLYAGVTYHQINWWGSFWLMVACVAFHFAVNAHNQLSDYFRFHKDQQIEGSHNNVIQRFQIPVWVAKLTIVSLAIFTMLIGLILVYQTGVLLLIIGIISFLVGYFYSGGPYPILKTPLGEPVSGITMGFNIVLLGTYINVATTVHVDGAFLVRMLLVALPTILVISNLMLANNISDLVEDQRMGRHTLITFIGQVNGCRLWRICYYLAYLAIAVGIGSHVLPFSTIVVFLTFPMVEKKINEFVHYPDKATTFLNSIQIILLILVSEIIGLMISLI